MLMCSLGIARARRGEIAEGLALLEEGCARADALQIRVRHAQRVGWLAEAYLRARRPGDAAAAIRRALALAEAHGERGYAAWARRTMAAIAARAPELGLGDPAEHLGAALAEARALSIKPLAAVCRLALGQISLARGDQGRAAGELATAAAELRALGMHPLADRAEALRAAPR
jgi:hypothetical protein